MVTQKRNDWWGEVHEIQVLHRMGCISIYCVECIRHTLYKFELYVYLYSRVDIS